LGKGESVVIAADRIIAGNGTISGKGPPPQICTEITSVDSKSLRASTSLFETNPAGRIELRNDSDTPVQEFELRWRKVP